MRRPARTSEKAKCARPAARRAKSRSDQSVAATGNACFTRAIVGLGQSGCVEHRLPERAGPGR